METFISLLPAGLRVVLLISIIVISILITVLIIMVLIKLLHVLDSAESFFDGLTDEGYSLAEIVTTAHEKRIKS